MSADKVSLGTDKVSLGKDKKSLGKDKHSLGTDKVSLGKDKRNLGDYESSGKEMPANLPNRASIATNTMAGGTSL